MRCVETIGDVDGRADQRLNIERPPSGDAIFHGFTIKELHGYERPHQMLAELVHGTDAGVAQPGGGGRFVLEPLQRHPVRCCLGQDLQGHAAVKIDIDSPIYEVHTAARDQFLDAIVRYPRANRKRAESLRGYFDRLAHTTNWRQKSVPLSSYRLDVPGVFGRVRQRHTKVIYSGVDAVFKIDNCTVPPQAAPNFLARHERPLTIDEQLQEPQRMLLNPHPGSAFEKLTSV